MSGKTYQWWSTGSHELVNKGGWELNTGICIFTQSKELRKAQIRLLPLIQSLVFASLAGELVNWDKACRSMFLFYHGH